MTEKISLYIFWTFMILCAMSALGGIWFGDVVPARLMPTFFIIGFAAFLIWAPLMVYKFFAKVK